MSHIKCPLFLHWHISPVWSAVNLLKLANLLQLTLTLNKILILYKIGDQTLWNDINIKIQSVSPYNFMPSLTVWLLSIFSKLTLVTSIIIQLLVSLSKYDKTYKSHGLQGAVRRERGNFTSVVQVRQCLY
jgi:hypothetical protein